MTPVVKIDVTIFLQVCAIPHGDDREDVWEQDNDMLFAHVEAMMAEAKGRHGLHDSMGFEPNHRESARRHKASSEA